jgi:hypothetical protein
MIQELTKAKTKMNKATKISENIIKRIENTYGDILCLGDLSIIRGIIEAELEKQEEFQENPLRKHWIYTGSHD